MSDDELMAHAAREEPVAWLRLALFIGFAVTLAAVIALIGPSPTGSWVHAITLGALFGWIPAVIVIIALVDVFNRMYTREPYVDELLRRAGWRPLDALVSESRERLSAMPDTGWLLLLHRRALPHGGEAFVRIEVYDNDEHTCCVDSASLSLGHVAHDAVRERDPRARLHVDSGELSHDEREELLDLLHGTDTQPPSNGSKHGVRDGSPFDLVALRNGPGQGFELQGNLADPNAPAHGRRLASCMADVARRLDAVAASAQQVSELDPANL